jgi:hypothetical protein
LNSGILQTNTGKAVSGLFTDALLRSIRPLGTLKEAKLKKIVDVLGNLPPGKWQAAFGENLRFSNEQGARGVMGFIQSRLDDSSAERDSKIANKQLVSDHQWNSIKGLVRSTRSYTQTENLRSAWDMLKDDSLTRPSPKDAQKHLAELIDAFRDSNEIIDRIKAVHDQFKPGYKEESAPAESAPNVLISLKFNKPLQLNAGAEGNKDQPDVKSPTLLQNLQRFERHGNFYLNVTDSGPRIPENNIPGLLLWAANLLDTFNVLRLDSSHISTTRPAPSAPAPSNHAWKNGQFDFSALPMEPAPVQPQVFPDIDALTSLKRFVEQTDEVLDKLTRDIMPWDSAHALELEEVKVLLDPLREGVYRATTEAVNVESSASPGSYLPDMNVVGDQLRSWLERASASLVTSGVASWNLAGDLIERYPGRAVGGLVTFAALSSLYAQWFLPEMQERVDPLSGIGIADEEFLANEFTLDGIAEILEEFPEFAEAVIKLVSRSDDPAEDPQLLEDIEALLQRPASGSHNGTYQDYLDEVIELATSEAQNEEGNSIGGSMSDPTIILGTELKMTNAPDRHKRSATISALRPIENSLRPKGKKMLIEEAQRRIETSIIVQAQEEFTQGVSYQQAADLFIKHYVELQTVLNPFLFIIEVVEKKVSNSDLPESLKSNVTHATLFRVDYDKSRAVASKGNYESNYSTRHKMFTLAELFTGQHEKETKPRESMKVKWPSGYTDSFKDSIKKTDIYTDHESRLAKVVARPQTFDLWKSNFKFRLKQLVADYAKGATVSQQGKETAEKFLKGEVRVRPISIKQGRFSDMLPVSNAVFLSQGNGKNGLFVFLEGNETVLESPGDDLFKPGRKSIEDFPLLRDALSNRIHIKDFLAREEDDFMYSQSRIAYGTNPKNFFSYIKWPYTPIIFGRKDGPTYYGEEHDAFKVLYERLLVKVDSDMDTLVSTWGERITDKLMAILVDTLTLYAMILALPGAPLAGIAFLTGASASAAQYTQGVLSDDPKLANQHKANAIIGMIAEVASPYIGTLLGKVVSGAMDSRLAKMICERLRYGRIFPPAMSKLFPKYRHPSSPFAADVNKVEKWIPAKVRNPWVIQDKFNRKLTNNLVVDRLNMLGKGPTTAQRMMDRSRVLYYGGKDKGYLYRGFAMRGDKRLPQDVFNKGFDAGNAGVKTSGYYDRNGVGAYHDGGKKGGYTYLIDGRKVDAYDVARNANKGSRLGSNPYDLTYPESIPGSKILGAYDKAGKFIPNPGALSNAVRNSAPVPFVESVLFPAKQQVQDKNFTRTPLEHPK